MASRADTDRERRAATRALLDWLAREEWARLAAIARAHGAERDAVADVVQAGLLAVLRSYRGPLERESIRRYACRCVQTETWRLHRRRSRRASRDVALESVAEPADEDEPATLVVRAEELREAAALLDELAPSERAAIVLVAAGFEREEIRRVLGLSERALRKRIERANRRLRELRGRDRERRG